MENTLTLEQMFEMQAELDAKIIKEKGLEGKDLIPNTVLALQVELGELANEWRGFKHWSEDQQPRFAVETYCETCDGSGDQNWPASREYLLEGQGSEPYEECEECKGTGKAAPQNRVLEEYVDCLHFFLSLGRQIGLTADGMTVWDMEAEGETTVLFTEILWHISFVQIAHLMEKKPKDIDSFRKEQFRHALFLFYAIGDQRFDFTFEQIAEAYAKKNAVNHERQANGY